MKLLINFITYAHNVDLISLKKICTEDTFFYIKMVVEPLNALGDKESIVQLKDIAKSIDCKGNGDIRKCFYNDYDGEIKYFEVKLIEDYDYYGKEKIFIKIDKKYFLGE